MMMKTIDINLLPGRKRKKVLSKQDKQIIFIGISTFFLLAAMYGGIWYTRTGKENKLSNLTAQVNSLSRVQKVLDTRAGLGNKVLYYETSIKNFTLKQTDWNKLIDEVAASLPTETKVNQIDADKTSLTITISGKTKNLQTLAWTMYSFSNNKDFSNITLKSYNVPYGEKNRVGTKSSPTTFTITFKWKGMKK